jgi:hypothetical protein
MGAFAAAALMSILVAKFFCDLALADEVAPAPSLNAPATVLGTYEIKDIIQEGGKGSLCGGTRPDYNCGKKIWLVRTDQQVAILEAQTNADPTEVTTSLLYPTLQSAQCKSWMKIEDARTGLFNSDFCRATHVPKQDNRKSQAFYFSPKLNMIDPIISPTIGLTSEASDLIRLPLQETIPSKFTIHKTITGSLFFILSGTVHQTFQLERVGD